ncbi:MAG: NADH-quinone oxidoreductase subunit NuoE [Thermodesulfobacteriota bacterium]
MLTDTIIREIELKIGRAQNPHHVCIDALLVVKKHCRWVSDEQIRDLARVLHMTPEEVDAVATFYNHIYRQPVGRHVILLCDSVSCWIMGYQSVAEYLSDRLGIGFGQTTSDGRFTMLPIQCLGVCEQAPAMMIDDDLHVKLDPGSMDRILETYP